MPRAKRLTTAEAAARVGISESQMRVIAHRDGIGRKEGGAWSFTEYEVKKLIAQRTADAAALKARQRWERERSKLKGLPGQQNKSARGAGAARRSALVRRNCCATRHRRRGAPLLSYEQIRAQPKETLMTAALLGLAR